MLNEYNFKTIKDLIKAFPDEKSCHQYLAARRWSDGIISCPYDDCNSEVSYVFKDGIRYKCKCCKRTYTVKKGTFFEGSNVKLINWFIAMFLVMHKKGISSVQLAKDLGVTQKTAWFMLHRVRHAFGNEPEETLSGVIQLDETFVGGKNKNRHADKKVKQSQGRSFKDKTPIMGMLQQEVSVIVPRPHKVIPGKIVNEKIIITPARLICKIVSDTKAESLQPIIKKHVENGSTIVSDEWFAYRGLNSVYNHQVVDHGRKQYVNEMGYTSNALECSWKELKLTVQATYVRPTRKHLEKYKNEFVFRYNNRHIDTEQQIAGIIKNMECRLKYKELVA